MSSLQTELMSRDAQPTPSPSFQITFTIPNHSFTGLKVNQLKVQGDLMYKPFKGVRQVAKSGKIDVRW
jgi:AP-3 complex subunit mu